ncbi:MAG: hypothetical protein M9926_09430, partial [Lentimicrobium sp.]|nr:hypothetical protein [Lentimicrobium sp.]
MNGSAVITINPLPTITLGTNPSICAGTTSAELPYTSTSGSPNRYSIDYNAAANAAGFIDITDNVLPSTPIILTSPAAAPAATYTAVLTVSNSTTGCTSTGNNFTVTINAQPIAPAEALTNRNNFCADDSGDISLSVTGGAGTTVGWYTGSCGGSPVGTGNPLVISSPTANTTYYARWESPTCTPSSCADVTVTVNPLPTPPASITSSANPVCVNAGGNITLTATGGSGTTLRWFTGSCGGTAIGTGNPLVIASPVTTTTYFARWENSCGNSACASLEVTVTPLPVPPTSAGVDRNNFCADDGGDITLTASGGSGATLQWHSGSCGGTLEGTGTSLTIASPTATTTYYARWVNDCGISTCAEVTVNVLPLPTAPTNASV